VRNILYGVPAPKRACDQVHVGASKVAPFDMGDRVIVRSNISGLPAVEEARRIEHGPQVRLTIMREQL
jgi:hypothetical protein